MINLQQGTSVKEHMIKPMPFPKNNSYELEGKRTYFPSSNSRASEPCSLDYSVKGVIIGIICKREV